MERQIFRKAALDRLSSPDQVDQPLQIARSPGRLLRHGVGEWLRGRAARMERGKARRVHTPTVVQMEAVECGAAALAIVLAYHGRVVPLEELRVACGVSRDGSNAANIVKAARSYGLLAKGYAKPAEALLALQLPLIAFWNFNHFVVLEGFGPGRVFLNDPAGGPRVASAEEFDEAYTGVVLVFEPGPGFVRGGHRPSLAGALRARLAGVGRHIALAVLATLALAAPGLAVPILLQRFVDGVLVAGTAGLVTPLLIGLALAAALRAVLTWLQQRLLLRLELRLALRDAGAFFRHVLGLPYAFFTQRYAGEVGARLAINDRVAALLSGELATAALNVVLVAVYALLMLWYDPWLTLVALGAALLNVVALTLIARGRRDASRRLVTDRGKLLGATYGGLEMIETLKAGGAEGDFFARWAGLHTKVLNAEQRLAVFTQVLAVAPPLVAALSTAAILTLGGLRVIDGALTIGMLVAFQSLAASMLAPVGRLVSLGGSLQELEAELARLDDVARYPAEPPGPALSPEELPAGARLEGRIELREVTFGFSPLAPPLIEGLSLHVPPGARVALVGGSGSGKSTVARLIAGLYRPWTGEILLDGRPRDSVPRPVLARSVAMVDQEIALVSGSVRENLTLWDERIGDEALDAATGDAAIRAELMARPGGYDAELEEGGRDLSGGQRQRLELARALALEPSILVLDEATSALDPPTEEQIDAALRRRGCTCLIVAHRLSTVRDADEILVLDAGRVVQRGRHDELIRAGGLYARLIQGEGAD
ncbi:MAG TPA: NHLP family bacteriocin export ABC transporter peptidase/permease/ATPase subunit [Chloroflexaceae bacterium]|nr:NHLP family bacteriocin export ABC transporter peptidase/permease/ATPase subunit [Chloroflexaceae bacterium]